MYRAKVRLKKRQKRNLTSLKSGCNLQTMVTALSSPSKSKTTTTLKPQAKTSVETHVNNEQRSRPQVQSALSSVNPSKVTTISDLGQQSELIEGANSISSYPIITRSFKVVYWSDRQSMTPKETGVPNVPPVTPSDCE